MFNGVPSRSRAALDTASLNISPLKPTPVFDAYWRFAAERQKIFFARAEGQPPPWTEDEILSTYKFTNAYRASDRVSQYLIRRVIYRDDLPQTIEEIFFRVMLFKLFNKVETWELLEEKLGMLSWADYKRKRYDAVFTNAMASGRRIYSAAYIMPSARSFGHDRKHRNHLALVEQMMRDELPAKIAQTRRMQDGFDLLLGYPSLGDFLAYQYVTDLNYSELTCFSEMDFVVAGPGALDGISKCFLDTAGLTPPEVIRFMADRQEAEFKQLGLNFQSLWGRRLQLIDCQNLFCEVSKYARESHPQVKGVANRTRIKQKFRPASSVIRYWYPPKWGINDHVTATWFTRNNL